MLERLNPKERLRLVRFVCSFAWADFRITQKEKENIRRLVQRLHMPEDERRQVDEYLKLPPTPESVDPNLIPYEHRELFLDAIRGLVASDLDLSTEEKESVQVLEQLLAGK